MSDTSKTTSLTAGITKVGSGFADQQRLFRLVVDNSVERPFDPCLAALELTAARRMGDASHPALVDYYQRLEQDLRRNGNYMWATAWAAKRVEAATDPYEPITDYLGLR